ncbi:hypothetical protein OSTOST_07282 [Ostertagia ostertagi]
MAVDVAPVPYSTIILHCLKYPHSGVYGVLLGSKTGNKIKEADLPDFAFDCECAAVGLPYLHTALLLPRMRKLPSARRDPEEPPGEQAETTALTELAAKCE